MRPDQYWVVKCTHAAGQYNDSDEFSIVDMNDNVVVKNCSAWRESLDRIVLAHNKCMMAMEQDNK